MYDENSDLEHLSFTELLEERAAVKARLREIWAETSTAGRPDDRLYRKWLRGIRAEQAALSGRQDQIKVMLAKRQREHAATKGPKEALLSPGQYADLEQRRAKLRADLAAGGPDALLLRCRRAMHHLCGGKPASELPIDAADLETFRDVAVYLRGRYGSTPISEALHGEEIAS